MAAPAAAPAMQERLLYDRLARMTPPEREVILRFRAAMRERRTDAAHAILADRLPDLVAGRGTGTFVGCAFDRLCATAFRVLGEDDAIAEVTRLCDLVEATDGPRPWTALFRGALHHLAEAHDEAVPHYAKASMHPDLLWAESEGCTSVVTRAEGLALARGAVPSCGTVIRHRIAPTAATIAFAACDPGYLRRFGPDYLRSLPCLNASVAAHLHLVGPEPADLAWIETGIADGHLPSLGLSSEPAPSAGRPAYLAACRYLRAPLLLDWYDRPLLISDIDGRYTAPLDPVHPALIAADAALWLPHRFRHHPWLAARAGMTIVVPTSTGRGLAETLARLTANLLAARHHMDLWYVDQNALHLLMLLRAEVAPGARIVNLSDRPLPGGIVFDLKT